MANYCASKFWVKSGVPDHSYVGTSKVNSIDVTFPSPTASLAVNDIIEIIQVPPWHEIRSVWIELSADDIGGTFSVGVTNSDRGAAAADLDNVFKSGWAPTGNEEHYLTPGTNYAMRSSANVDKIRALALKVTAADDDIKGKTAHIVVEWFNRQPKR